MEIPKSKSVLKVLVPLLGITIFFAALFFLYRELRAVHYKDVLVCLHAYPAAVLALAGLATAVNYLTLTLYDVLALRYIGKSVPYHRAAFASFLSYVSSYNIGLSVFGSSAVRMRLYPAWGLEAGSVARIVAFCAATFWLGLATMGGLSFLTDPPSFAASWRLLGLLPLVLVGLYLWAAARGRAEFRIRDFHLPCPSIGIATSQILVASLDWTFAAMVLYILLPPGRPPFPAFVAVFVLAQLAASSSHIPGGVGVFETVIIAALSRSSSHEALMGALLAYRGIYYLAPLAVAVVAFAGREVWEGRKKVAGAIRTFAGLTPAVLSVAVFLSGVVLLFSGAVPSAAARLEWLDPFVPLPVLELSHFSASLVGMALLVVADAIRRRVDAAYWTALALLVAGALFSLLKGFDWEEATMLLVSLMILAPARPLFIRRAALLSRNANPWAVIVAGIVVATSFWLVAFANKHAIYSNESWWTFEFSKASPRSLRAAVGVAIAAAAFGLRTVLRPEPRLAKEDLAASGEDVRRVLKCSTHAAAKLALLGDKFFKFTADRDAFLMYGLSGSSVVVMGDPVGDQSKFLGLLWDFYEEARRQGGQVAWYEVSPPLLPLLAELGLRFYKIGEEATVNLRTFTLEGGAGKRLRPPRNKLLREGYSFSVIPPEETLRRIPELRIISDDWLRSKKGKEKGFSLGFFDEKYLSEFPCALVEREGRTIAFANLWTSGDGKEVAIDLMRHSVDAPNGTMEFMFIEIMLWGEAHGFERMSLGIAPLSGVQYREAAPFWNKAVALIFRNGEGIYNFKGLRAFKEKFSPSWEPRYVALSGGSSLPILAADMARVVGKGKHEAQSATAPKI